MTIESIFSVVAAALLSLGGGGTIVVGLSSWLGKVWANRILENEKAEHTKEIEEYKSRLNHELQRLSVENQKALHVSNAHYDKEFTIYQEVWTNMINCIFSAKRLFPNGLYDSPTGEEELLEFNIQLLDEFHNTRWLFMKSINIYAPFYEKGIFNNFNKVLELLNRVGFIFKTYNIDVKISDSWRACRDTKMPPELWSEAYDNLAEVDKKKSMVQDDISKHLQALKITE